ncbi:MAG: hypothetical protein ACTSV3_01905 [Candidatus Thorarchaeota archaeon]|nr:MAG: hypothetical protein DRO87_13145 [Candidatus Thorarchaeota archaeon]RLI56866.1 MAG: hypothetical protein DRP09_04890 [Candidatus Thorarchaeota archaeon]
MDKTLTERLELCGFATRDHQESRLLNLLVAVMKIQEDPPVPLEFGQIYDQLRRDLPSSRFTKAWVHRILKKLTESQLVRLESPGSRRKRYIADVNSIMTGLEELKSQKIKRIETQITQLEEEKKRIEGVECGALAQDFVRATLGRDQKMSSRVLRGVDEVHRVLRYNMTDVAGKGDVLRTSFLWGGPWMNHGIADRVTHFVKAAVNGADVRYLVAIKVFNLDAETINLNDIMSLMSSIRKLREKGAKFDVRLYTGEKTYNQISLNRDRTVLVITENPATATWITREFNPDLIDNAVDSFDRAWESSKSLFDISPEEMKRLGGDPNAPIGSIVMARDDTDQ